LLAVAILGIGGCPGKGPKMVRVSGTVKFKDGTSLPAVQPGGAAIISFEPADMGDDAKADPDKIHKRASSGIKPDGSFDLCTVRTGDGVIPGRYKVIVTVRNKGPDPATSLIPQKYGNPETNEFGVIEIDKARSDFEFLLDKQ
jgi:hypothetical protein